MESTEFESWSLLLEPSELSAWHRFCPASTNATVPAENGAAVGEKLHWCDIDVPFDKLPESWKDKNRMCYNYLSHNSVHLTHELVRQFGARSI